MLKMSFVILCLILFTKKIVFYHRKLNKDNKLTKTIYENYLRTSMPCSFPCCTSYTHTSKTSKNEHYIIPSKKALINYLPLFIDKNINTIILNSTLEQIRIDSLTEYKRITEAIKNKFVFYNNFFVQTYVEQLNNKITYTERMNDSFENCENDYEDVYEYKCIERALQYYKNHVNKKIIVVTPNNVHLVPALYNNESEIADLIAKGLKEKTMYDEYYNEERLNTLCQQGSVLKGILYINAHNSFGGIVHAEYKGRRIRVRIDGRNDLNRALNMDGVYVEIKKEESIENGTAHNNIINITDETNNGENGTVQNNINKTEEKNTDIENGTAKMSISNSIADKSKGVKLEPEVIGKVVGIYKRDFISLIGTIDKNSINGSGPQFVLVIPLDKKIPKIRIKTSQVDEIEDKRIMVRINEWDRESYYPFGSYVRCMGSVGDEKTEIESILLSNGIDYSNYADTFGIENVIENLNKKIESYKTEGEKSSNEGGKRFKNGDDKSEIVVPENEHLLKVELENVYKNVLEYESKVREDIRDLDVLSIDPPGCTDIDDALHCRKVGDLYEVGVHIADVSFFVEKDSLLDNEALKRGTTVYLTDRRFDMLPTYLSSNLCSLIAEQDRLAFSVFIYFDKDFTIQNTTFKKTVIRSKRSFTYDQAQSEMTEGQYKDDIRMLNSIAKNLKHKRIAAGALELSSTELKIYTKNRIARSKTHANKNHIDERVRDAHDDDLTVENELPEIDRIEQKVLNETNSLVEEFMLLANILVANELYAHHKDSAMLRRHPKFADDSFDELKEYLSKRNIDLNYLSSKELNDSIKTIEDGQFKELIKKIITRSMNQAVYFSSGSVPYEDFLHYGLAASIYTHFTSPIRRYADLIVHRQLDYVISNKSNLYDNDKIEEICRTINYRKRNAMYANLECDRLFTYLYLKGKILEERGYITRIKNGGIVIYIPSLGIEEIIKLEYEFDEERNCFVRDGNYVYELYSDVKVKIQENDEKFFIERHFDIEIIEE